MTTTAQFLQDLQTSGIYVVLQDGRVRIKVPQGPLAPEIRQQLHARRDELCAWLSAASEETLPVLATVYGQCGRGVL